MMENSTRELLKLKVKDGEVVLKYQVVGSGFPETITIESTEPPRKELTDALQAMARHVIKMCELPDLWWKDLTVRGVTITRNDVDGVVITALRELDGSNSPLVLNTPHFTREGQNEEQELGIYSLGCGNDLDALERLAFEYVDGKRQQEALQFEPEPDLVLNR